MNTTLTNTGLNNTVEGENNMNTIVNNTTVNNNTEEMVNMITVAEAINERTLELMDLIATFENLESDVKDTVTGARIYGPILIPTRIVSTRDEFRRLIPAMMKMDQFVHPSLVVGFNAKKNNYTLKVKNVSSTISRVYSSDFVNTMPVAVVRDENSKISYYENKFSWGAMSLELDQESMDAKMKAALLYKAVVYVAYDPTTGWYDAYINDTTKKIGERDMDGDADKKIDLVEHLTDEEIDRLGSVIPLGGRSSKAISKKTAFANRIIFKYRGYGHTASNSRQDTYNFLCVGVKNNLNFSNSVDADWMKACEEIEDTRAAIMNNATRGALDKIIENLKTVNFLSNDGVMKTVAKMAGYLGNVITGSVNNGVVTGFVEYKTKWLNSTDESFLTDEFMAEKNKLQKALNDKESEEVIAKIQESLQRIAKKVKGALKKQATQDGQLYINARVFVELLMKRLGSNIVIKPEAVQGIMLQLRPATVKASALVVSETVFEGLVEGTKKLAQKAIDEATEKFNAGEISQEKLDKIVADQQVIAHGDTNNLLFLADSNCIKLPFNVEEEITMEILAYAKCSKVQGSKQFFETVYSAFQDLGMAEEGKQIIYDMTAQTVDNLLADATANRKAKILTPEEIAKAAKTGFITDAALALDPTLVLKSRPFFNSVMNQLANTIQKKVDGMNTELNGHNRRLSSDPTFILTGGDCEGVMNFGEVYIHDKRVKKAVMVKYPKMGRREYYACKNVSAKQIRTRANAIARQKAITCKEAELVSKLYAEMDDFTAVLPAKMVVAKACAGLDFDYDGAMFVEQSKASSTHERYNELLSKENLDVEELAELEVAHSEFVKIYTNKIVEVLFAQRMLAVDIIND